MATDLEEKAQQAQQDSPQLLRSPDAAGSREQGKAAALPTPEVDAVSGEPTRGTSTIAAFAPLALKYGRGSGATQAALPHSVRVENSFCEAWQRNRGPSLRSTETVVSQERTSKTIADLSSPVGRGASRCVNSRNTTNRPAVPAPRPGAAASASRRETCGAASWAAVAAGGVSGGRRPATVSAGQHTRSSVDAPGHSGVPGRANERRFPNPQNGSSGIAAQQQSLSASREIVLSAGGSSTSRPHNIATDSGSSGQGKADEAGVSPNVTYGVATRQDLRGGSTLIEHEGQRQHNVDVAAENQRTSASCASGADPFNAQQELLGGPSPSAPDCVGAAATARTCVNNGESGFRSEKSSSGGIHTRTNEESGGAKHSSSCRGSAGTCAPRLVETPNTETGGGRLGEDNFGLSKLLQLLPRASNQTTGGLDSCGKNVGFPWETRKQAGDSSEPCKLTGSRDPQLGAIQQPSIRDWALPVGSKDLWGPGGKPASSNTLSEAESPSLREGAAPAARGAFHGDIAKNTASAASLATEQEEKNNAAATAASREIAFLIGQWPKGHQQREPQQDSKQGENTCLAEAVCHGNPRGKIQMGVFTETSPLDDSVLAAWLPGAVASPPPCTKRPSSCSEQQRRVDPLGGDTTLSGLTGARGGAALSLTEGTCVETDPAFMQRGGTVAGVSSVARLPGRQAEPQRLPHYSPPPARVDFETCGSRFSGNNLQRTSASEPPASQGRMDKVDSGGKYVEFQWPVGGTGAVSSRETRILPPQSAAEPQQPQWLQAWASEKDGVGGGIRDVESVEHQMLQRFMSSLEKQRTHRNEVSNCGLPSSLDVVANALTVSPSDSCAAPSSSAPPPPPPPPPPPLVAAAAFSPEWLQQSGEQTSERGPRAQQKGGGCTARSAITSCGGSLAIDDTFQSEGGNFPGGIRPPPGLAARGSPQQQDRRLVETDRKTFNASLHSGTSSREQQNKAFSQESVSVAAQQGRVAEKRKTARRHDGNYGHGTHDRVEETDPQQQRCRQSLSGGEVDAGRSSCTAEQGQQLWKQQHQPRQLPVSTYPVTSKETGETNTLEGAGGGSAGIWQLRKVLSEFHQQQRASATRQGLKPPTEASAASAVLTVAQRVAAAAALLRQEQQQAGSRNQLSFQGGITSVADVNRNTAFCSNSSNNFSRTALNSLGRFPGEEQETTSADRSDIAAVLLGLQNAAAHAVDGGVEAQTQLQSPTWAASSAYASENVRGFQDEQKIHPHEGNQPLVLDGSRHRSGPALVARSSGEELGAYCSTAEGGGGGGFSYGLQRQQQQPHMRSSPLKSPTMPSQQRQRLGRHVGSRVGYVDPSENQYRHTRDSAVRQAIRGLRGNVSGNTHVRSSSCVPLPSSLSETEQEESTRGVAMWEKVNLLPEQQPAAATAKAADVAVVGAEGSRFVSHERAGIFCFGGRRGEAGELCNELRVLQGSAPDSFYWSTLPTTGTPPPPCSGMATVLALRPASGVIPSSSPANSLAEELKGDSSDQETTDLQSTAVRQGKSGVAGSLKWEGMETARITGRSNSRGDMNEKETLPSSGSSQDKLQESSRTLDNEKSSNLCAKRPQGPSEGTVASVSAERQHEGEDAWENNAGTTADVLANGTDRSRISRITTSGHKDAFSKENVAEQQGRAGDRRLTLLVYGGRYVDGFADWTSLYECDLTTKTWSQLRVDVSRLPHMEMWRSSTTKGAKPTSPARGDISSCSTAALSCDFCVSTSRTKSMPSEDTLSPAPPLPGALQESSWCYSEFDDCVYVFGGVCRESQLQESLTGMQRVQQQSQRKRRVQEQQGGEAEKYGDHSSDDMEHSGSESRGEGTTTSGLARQLPPAWQCQNMLWRLDLGRLQWILVDVGSTAEKTLRNVTSTGVPALPKKHGNVSLSSQSSQFGLACAAEAHPPLEDRGGSDVSERHSDRSAPEVCTHSSSPASCKGEEEKVQQMRQDKAEGDMVDGKCDSPAHAGVGDSSAGRVAFAPRSSRAAGDMEDEQFTYDEDLHKSRRCSVSSSTLPKGRAGHSCVYKDGALWIFGGSNTQEELADFFRFDLKRQNWQEIKGGPRGDAGRRPCARYGHAATVLGDFMILFGGYGGKQAFLADLYTFHFPTYSWVKVAAQGAIPAPRFRCGAGTHEGYFFIFAGRGGMQHPVQQQPSQQQLQRQWSDSSPPPSGDGGAVGAGCKRSVVFVDAARIRLPVDEMLVSHQHVVVQRNEKQQGLQQGNPQHEEAYFKGTSRSTSSHPDVKKVAAKQDFQMNSGAAMRESEKFFDDAAQQRMQVASGAKARMMTDRRVNHPQSGTGSRASSTERERSNSTQLQVQRSPDGLRDVAATHDSERDATAGIASRANEGDRVSAVAAAMLELLQQHTTQQIAGGNNLYSNMSRGGEGERASAVPTTDERSRGVTTAATLNRLKAQLQQQLLPGGKDAAPQGVAEQQDRQAEEGTVVQHQDLVRALYARLQDVEQKARTTESEQRHETVILQEQIRRASITLTTLYTKLWNAANEVARGQKENERLQSELAARDAIITRQQAELEALTAKYRRAQVEIAFLLKPHQQQGRADGSPTTHGVVSLRGGEELPSPARAGAPLNMTRAYNVAGLPASADSFSLQRRLPQHSPPPQFSAHQKQDAQR